METRDRWIFLTLFAGFSTILFLVTVLIAQLETYVPGRKSRSLPPSPDDEIGQESHDESTAA
jgi:hypothetical protein